MKQLFWVWLSAAALVGCGDDGSATPDDAGTGDAGETADAGGGEPGGGTDAGARFVNNCGPEEEPPGPYPAPDAWGPNAGPGGPAVTFEESALYENCAFLDGGEGDDDHHNLVTMLDGYLLMPWAHDLHMGGITLWDISDPCSPERVGYGATDEMRETHSIGFSNVNGRWAVTDSLAFDDDLIKLVGGVLFWDLSDLTAPTPISRVDVPEFEYIDAYARVVASTFWQVPYVYAGGADNGVYIIDATDPRYPEVVGRHSFDPIFRVGQVQAIGNLLVVTGFESARTALLDISDPAAPQPIPGGDFLATDAEGMPREAYFTNTTNGFVYYARKDSGGGVMIWDIRDPTAPAYSGSYRSDHNGGYVFVKDHYAFVGEGSSAGIYDISDHESITEVTRLDLEGDLDTATPIGNVVLLSVDADAVEDQGSSIAPWQTEPDTDAPQVTWAWPADGADNLPTTSRFGLTFSEMVDVQSAFAGSVRLYETGTDPDTTRVDGWVSAQENIVNFHPRCGLEPNTEYTLEVPAGGIVDFNGNAVAETFTATFRTGG